MNKRAGLRAIVTAAGAAFLMLAGTGVATAQEEPSTRAAISCMEVVNSGVTGLGRWVQVENKCAWTYKVKVVWNNGPDGICKDLPPGYRRYSEAHVISSYAGTHTC